MRKNQTGLHCLECLLVACLGILFVFVTLGPATHTARAEMRGETASAVPEFYPDRFDGIGRIGRITMNEIVIDDILYRLSPNAAYATPERKHALRAWFRVGDRVGFNTNAKHQIISLWLLAHPEK